MKKPHIFWLLIGLIVLAMLLQVQESHARLKTVKHTPTESIIETTETFCGMMFVQTVAYRTDDSYQSWSLENLGSMTFTLSGESYSITYEKYSQGEKFTTVIEGTIHSVIRLNDTGGQIWKTYYNRAHFYPQTLPVNVDIYSLMPSGVIAVYKKDYETIAFQYQDPYLSGIYVLTKSECNNQ